MVQAKLARMVKLATIMATLILIVLLGIVGYQYIKLNSLAKKESALDTKISQLSVTKTRLENGIEIRSTDAYVEQQARENLGMIKDDESVYIID